MITITSTYLVLDLEQGQEVGMFFSRFGIGARLFLAFIAITAVSLTSGFTSWLILREISEAQMKMNLEALPAVAVTERMADQSARLVAAAPALISAKDTESWSKQDASLALLANEIQKSVANARLSLLDRGSVTQLAETADALISNLSLQSSLVRERLQLDHEFLVHSEKSIFAATSIVSLSETLVSNASAGASAVVAGLYGLIDDPARREESFDALDRLIEQDIYLLDRMSELRLRSSQIGLLVNRLTRAINQTEVADIAFGYQEQLRVVSRRVASIDDPVRREQAEGFFSVLASAGRKTSAGDSLFSQRLRLLSIGDELDRLARVNRDLSGFVSQIAQAMLKQSEQFARTTTERSSASVEAGWYGLIASSLVSLVISGLIVWLYVERKVVRRILNLSKSMQRLTDGDLSVDVKEEGTHELRALSKAVRAFRDVSLMRRSLEEERERTNEELRRHREELQMLVNERTSQLSEINTKLQREVVQHADARSRAESASRAKSDFLSTMSHEIRTPMTGMLGLLRILHESPLLEEQKKQLAVAAASGAALMGILNSILDYSKIESGKIIVDPVTFSLGETLEGIVVLMRPSAREKGLSLHLEIDPNLAKAHICDNGKLRQIVFNLVSNAIKFTETGEVVVKAKLLSEQSGHQNLELSVSDTGIGISKGDQKQIFESFTQKDASITRRFGGTGLGLAIARQLATLLGGALTVRSIPRRGSTFSFRLSLPTSDLPLVKRQLKDAKKPLSKSLKILIVEDDSTTRIVAQSFLENLGHSVVTAADGRSAIDKFEDLNPDLVFMDISLPGIDGIQTAAQMRQLSSHKSFPIIAMSAHVFQDEVARHLQSGMNGFVGKPFTPEMLETVINDAINGRAVARSWTAVDQEAFRKDLEALGTDAMKKILAAAQEALPIRFVEMQEALTAKDMQLLGSLAHATRSSAASAGFPGLYASAEALELAAKNQKISTARKHIRECKSRFEIAMREASEVLEMDKFHSQDNLPAKR